MKRFNIFSVVFCLFAFHIAAGQENSSSLHITYLANEGVYLESGETSIVIDGLFRDGVSSYMTIPSELLEKLETATGRFADTDLVLVTHLHPDHYDAASVFRHLSNNPKTSLVAGSDVVDLLKTEAGDGLKSSLDRIHTIELDWKQDSSFTVAGVQLTALRTRHGWWKNYGLDHLGYVIELNGMRVLHLGDLEMTEENLSQFTEQLVVDVAILPHWLLTYDNGIELMNLYIKTRNIIAVHIEPAKLEEITKNVHKTFPQAVIAGKALQKASFTKP